MKVWISLSRLPFLHRSAQWVPRKCRLGLATGTKQSKGGCLGREVVYNHWRWAQGKRRLATAGGPLPSWGCDWLWIWKSRGRGKGLRLARCLPPWLESLVLTASQRFCQGLCSFSCLVIVRCFSFCSCGIVILVHSVFKKYLS